jgi:hypothetical protein
MAGLLDYIAEAAKAQYAKGAPYRNAIGGLLSGDMTALQELNKPSQVMPNEALDVAMTFAPMGITKAVGNKFPLTEFELAQNLAQQRAALPISEGGLGLPASNTAMQRAEAMYFPNIEQTKNYNYHSSRSGVEGKIDPSKSDLGFHVGTEEQALDRARTLGQLYGKGQDYLTGATTYPILIRRDASFLPVIDEGSFRASEIAPQFETKGYLPKGYTDKMLNKLNNNPELMGKYDQQMRDVISAKKYQGVKYNNASEGEGVSYAVTDPSAIRSPFAAFDPFRRNEADILAGVGVGVPVASGLLDIENKKVPKKEKKKTK